MGMTRPKPLLAIFTSVSDLVLTIGCCVINVRIGGHKATFEWNPCVASKPFGSLTADLIFLVVLRNLALCISRRRHAWYWEHVAMCELTYALSKVVSRALGFVGSCGRGTDASAAFFAACFFFAFFAYASLPGKPSEEEGKKEVPRSSEASADGVSLLRTPLLSAGEGDEEQPEQSQEASSYKDMLSLARPDALLFLAAMILAVCAAVTTSAISLWTGDALDVLIKKGNGPEFKTQLEQLAIIAAVGAVCTGGRGGLFSMIGVRVNRRIRNRLFRHLLSLELGFFDSTATGDLNSRLSSDTAKIGDQCSLNVNVFARTGVQLATTLGFMIHSSPQLTLVACASVPLIAVVTKKYGEYVWALSKKMQDRLADAMRIAEEALSSMPTVRSMAAEEYVADDFTESLNQYADVGFAQARAYAAWQSFNTALPNLVTILLLYDGGRLVDEGGLSGGRLVAFMLLTQSLSDSFNTLADMYSNISEAFGAADKVFVLLRTKPGPGAPVDPYRLTTTEGTLRRDENEGRGELFSPKKSGATVTLVDVHFRYPVRPEMKVLHGLSLRADPGSVVALVGPSGGGKSSVMSLVQHFYVPETGTVTLDGANVSSIPHAALHRQIALVGQEPVLFARSVKRNIAYACDDQDTLDVRPYLRLANAESFVDKLPRGLETDVGERGAQMSGGQKQRIAIARALARRPSLLLLDESTSALDSESEKKVQASLDSIIKASSMTVIVIAHRLSTIEHADQIYCIDNGRVVERGTHEQLLANSDSLYADLVRKQKNKASPS